MSQFPTELTPEEIPAPDHSIRGQALRGDDELLGGGINECHSRVGGNESGSYSDTAWQAGIQTSKTSVIPAMEPDPE